ncbi:MAG: hypothetical protein JNM70_14620 [Anaerolineae bacterium]|nr:hypothetical protein [Anaerolineae bacterium]
MFNHLRGRMLLWFVVIFAVVMIALPAVLLAQSANGFNVIYGGRIYDSAANRTTFTYLVAGNGSPPDLSHFDLEIPNCPTPLIVAAYEPANAVSFGTDPTTDISGIKWDIPLQATATRTYAVTFQGNVLEGSVMAAVKAGSGFATISVPGPSCAAPKLDVEKFVSFDGVTWQDADAAPGPIVTPGTAVTFRFNVMNSGNVELTNLSLSDSTLDVSTCALPAALPPGAFFECVIGPQTAVDGQHTNTVTASGAFNGIVVSDSDAANYFSGLATPTPAATMTPTATPLPDDDSDLPITIIIEGPVQEININIITIYDIDIVVGETDPILGIIQLGDVLYVEGNTEDADGVIVIIAVNIVIINVDINIDTGEYWRDDGSCANPPPPWAPANGWRRRCGDAAGTTIIIQSGVPLIIPDGCKLTGFKDGNVRLKCSKKSKK